MSVGGANKSHIHSHMSPDLNLHSPKAYRGKDKMEMSGSGDYAKRFSGAGSTMDLWHPLLKALIGLIKARELGLKCVILYLT